MSAPAAAVTLRADPRRRHVGKSTSAGVASLQDGELPELRADNPPLTPDDDDEDDEEED